MQRSEGSPPFASVRLRLGQNRETRRQITPLTIVACSGQDVNCEGPRRPRTAKTRSTVEIGSDGASTRNVLLERGRWELLKLPRPEPKEHRQVRLLHKLAKISATFDDPHLVSQAGLVPMMAWLSADTLDRC